MMSVGSMSSICVGRGQNAKWVQRNNWQLRNIIMIGNKGNLEVLFSGRIMSRSKNKKIHCWSYVVIIEGE